MKNTYYYILLFILTTLLSCSFKSANLAGFYQVKYYIEYSPDESFSYISRKFEFYNRSRDKYNFKPEQIDSRYWISNGGSGYGSKMQRFARIVGYFNDSMAVLTTPREFSGCILTIDDILGKNKSNKPNRNLLFSKETSSK